ncbi:MAG: cysteine peptidase family C39 domain-containing protein [Acidobacteria bacterium]|nr:cysteine peptidase family C39 domain-containing protein [Acidobacteriota bacterium]
MPYTINTLAKMAADFGVALRPVFLNMSELRTCRKPVIVHVQGASPDEGTFLLVLRLTGRRVVYMNGPSATVGTIQQDTFRRVWSGCALLPADSALTHAALCVALFFTGLGLAVAWAMARTGKVLSAAPDQAL